MKDYKYTIKISDILRNLGSQDTISFTNKFSTYLPQLDDDGINCSIQLTALSDEQLMVTIHGLKAGFNVLCGTCGTEFNHQMILKEISIKGVLESKIEDNDDELIIDEKNGIIDLEDIITHSISVHEPVVYLCKSCQNKTDVDIDDIDLQSTIKRSYK